MRARVIESREGMQRRQGVASRNRRRGSDTNQQEAHATLHTAITERHVLCTSIAAAEVLFSSKISRSLPHFCLTACERTRHGHVYAQEHKPFSKYVRNGRHASPNESEAPQEQRKYHLLCEPDSNIVTSLTGTNILRQNMLHE